MVSVKVPEGWSEIVTFTQQDRSSFEKIRKAKPSTEKVKSMLRQLLENIKTDNCSKNAGFIKALGKQP